MDISDAAAPKSDQINADDLMSGPRVVTIVDSRPGNAEQPVELITAEFGPSRPYRPGKSMIRVLINAWGPESSTYKGRQLTIYRDPDITFGRDKVGGIRISHMSHIDKKLTLALTVTRGQRKPYIVEPMPDAKPVITNEQATELAGKIEEAPDHDALKAIAAQLKTFQLAAHRDALFGLWKARGEEITAAAQSPTDGADAEQQQLDTASA